MYDIDTDPRLARLEQEHDELSLLDRPDCHDLSFHPRGECSACDEPFERGYSCDGCGAEVCPCCVCCDLRDETSNRFLCSDCEGAGFWMSDFGTAA